MTMFKELYALASAATLTMIVSADEKTGKLTVSVLPKPKKDLGEPALTKDLTLTATPEEFDTEFIEALRRYREKRASLAEQAEATNEVLEAAKSASAKKAAEAMSKAAKPAQSTKASPVPDTKARAGDQGEGGENSGDQAGSPTTATAAPGEPQLFG